MSLTYTIDATTGIQTFSFTFERKIVCSPVA